MKVTMIINPASGQDYPILSVANRIFNEANVEWEVMITKNDGDAFDFARFAQKQKVDAVIVYGGDGTVMEAAAALHHSSTPLAVLSGGTANVVAKELKIPSNPEEALRLYLSKEVQIKDIDMGKITIFDEEVATTRRFVLRINLGLLADVVINTSRERKNTFGNLAYTVSALEQIPNSEMIRFHTIIDGNKMELEGASLMVTNAGNVGLAGIQFESHISVTDGKIDLILVKGGDIGAMIQLMAGAVLNRPLPVMEHWHGKKITVELDKSRFVIVDDVAYKMQKAVIEVEPNSLRMLMPGNM